MEKWENKYDPTNCIPIQRKTQQEKDQDWVDKQKEWSEASERQTMEYLIKRRSLQARLEQLNNRLYTQSNKILLKK